MLAKTWQKIKGDPLYRLSLIFIIGNFAASVLGYLYHLFMGRNLDPSEYAIVASLLSVSIIISVPSGTIQMVVMRYVAQYRAQKNYAGINWLQHVFATKMFWVGCVITAIFLLLSPWISDFLQINSIYPVAIMSLTFIFSFLVPVFRGILQGAQRFGSLCWSLIADAGAKLLMGIALVWLGFQAGGALAALVIGGAAGLVVAWQLLRRRKIVAGEQPTKTGELFRYAVPVMIVLLILALLYNIDVILVKHYFSGEEAGFYAALSQLGKIIVFGTGAIASVMFPLVVDKFEKHENYQTVLWKAIGIVSLLSGIAVAVYFGFPQLIISLLYGQAYLALGFLLGYVAIFMALYSVLNVLVQFFISIKNYGFIAWLVGGVTLQIVLIILYHDTLDQVILTMDFTMALITAFLFIYYGLSKGKFLPVKKTVDPGAGL